MIAYFLLNWIIHLPNENWNEISLITRDFLVLEKQFPGLQKCWGVGLEGRRVVRSFIWSHLVDFRKPWILFLRELFINFCDDVIKREVCVCYCVIAIRKDLLFRHTKIKRNHHYARNNYASPPPPLRLAN